MKYFIHEQRGKQSLNALKIVMFCTLFFLIAGCKKDSADSGCGDFHHALVSDDVGTVRLILNRFIYDLPSTSYTQENLERLSHNISGACDISAELLCFSCIQTLPEQSEIKLSFVSSGMPVTRIIDLSYSPDNRIKFMNMHH